MSIQRTAHLDVLRGFVMVVMSIDHSRDFFQPTGLNPEDPNSASLLFFFIRWITHLCAPTFVLLAGASVPLAARSREPKQMRKLLLTRGLWLMFLECTWVTFSWYFDFRGIHLGILWGIGGAMVLMSLCSGLSTRLLGTVALLYLCAHPFLPDGDGLYNWLTKPQGFELLDRPIYSVYVILPWFAVLAVGQSLSTFLSTKSPQKLAKHGVLLLVLFVVLRGLQLPDWNSWEPQHSWNAFIIDFLNPSKYPPSLQFLLMTIGSALLLLPVLMTDRLAQTLRHFGTVPMLYYLLHLPLLHLMGLGWAQLVHGQSKIPSSAALSILLIVAAAMIANALLLPVCRWWNGHKQQHRDAWWRPYL